MRRLRSMTVVGFLVLPLLAGVAVAAVAQVGTGTEARKPAADTVRAAKVADAAAIAAADKPSVMAVKQRVIADKPSVMAVKVAVVADKVSVAAAKAPTAESASGIGKAAEGGAALPKAAAGS